MLPALPLPHPLDSRIGAALLRRATPADAAALIALLPGLARRGSRRLLVEAVSVRSDLRSAVSSTTAKQVLPRETGPETTCFVP